MDRKRKARVSKKSMTQKQASKQKQVVTVNIGNNQQIPQPQLRYERRRRQPKSRNPPPPSPPPAPSTIVMYQPSSVLPPAFGGQIAGSAPGLGISQTDGNRLGQSISRPLNIGIANPDISQGISGLSMGSSFDGRGDSIPPAQAYPFPPQLAPVIQDPVRIFQNAGSKLSRSNPFRSDDVSLGERSIDREANPFEGRAADTDILNFQQAIATNELLRREESQNNTNTPATQDIVDEYNGQQIPVGQYMMDPIPPPPAILKKGRPFKMITDEEYAILEQYVRISTISARQRSEQDRSLFDMGKRILAAKRNNPFIAGIIQSLKVDYENSGK